jgi:hypothetical protein
MDGFKDSTRMKYMCGGPVKKATGGPVKMFEGGTYNERGKRATMAEIAAEDRRMANAKREKAAGAMAARLRPPVEGISTRPTDSSGRRMTNEELGIGVSAKKPMPKAPADRIGGGAMAGAAAGALAGAAARAAAKAVPRGMGAMSDREMQMLKAAAAKKGVPAHSDRPVIRRSKGGLMAMPKGKC